MAGETFQEARRQITAGIVMVIAMAVLSSSPSAGQTAADPTFNGTVNGATCCLRDLIVCSDDYCQYAAGPFSGDAGGTLELSFRQRRYRYNTDVRPLEIDAVSQAQLNSPLWVKFKVQQKDDILNMMVSLRPTPGGGYATKAVGTLKIKGATNGGIAVENFDCSRAD